MPFEDVAYLGPFASDTEREQSVAAAFRAVNLVFIDKDSFRSGIDFIMRTFRTRHGSWIHLPGTIARYIDAPAFASDFVYSDLDPWGAPIGYEIHELVRRDGYLHRGARLREQLVEDMHPDDGAGSGAVEEIQRRADDPETPDKSLAFYTWGDTLDDDFLDRLLFYVLSGETTMWRPYEGGYELQVTVAGSGHRAELDAEDASQLERAFQERTGRSLASFDRPHDAPLGYAIRRDDQ